MKSTMQRTPLNTQLVFEHGLKMHAEGEVITNEGDGKPRRSSFAGVGERVERLAAGLRSLGVKPGDRVATLCWNRQEHLEAYFAIPGMGAVLHPLNLRLFPDQLSWIINHAEDRVLVVDSTLLPLAAKALEGGRTVDQVIVIGESDDGGLGEVVPYEELLKSREPGFAWPDLDEDDAATLCYTSGTTGNPKAVAYSHRAIYLQAIAQCSADSFAVSQGDRILLVVPMFHANGWGLPFTGWLAGSDFILPGPNLHPEHLAKLIKEEGITFAQGVPTIWNDMLTHTEKYGVDLSSLRIILSGGSAVPRSLIESYADRFNVSLVQAWGMTEGGPLMAIALPPHGAPPERALDYRCKSGRIVAGTQARAVDESGNVLPWDGVAIGELELRGPCIAGSYYLDPSPDKFRGGWLRTGDVGTIDEKGYVQLTDRLKDVIKSGGEWISSVELEGRLMAHSEIVEAAVVGVPDDRWQERPLACVVRREGSAVGGEELRTFLADQVARWWLPERWTFLPEIPKTSVGKFDKKLLRARYSEGLLPVSETLPT